MAGVKGRSGGARPGAGRKPKPKPEPAQIPAIAGQTPLDFLLSVQNDPAVDEKLRVRAAIAAAQYMHVKKGDGGIKDAKQEAAKKAGAGKFSAAAPPLALVRN